MFSVSVAPTSVRKIKLPLRQLCKAKEKPSLTAAYFPAKWQKEVGEDKLKFQLVSHFVSIHSKIYTLTCCQVFFLPASLDVAQGSP